MRGTLKVWFAATALLVACGGSPKPAESPEPSEEPEAAEPAKPEPKAEAPKSDEGKGDEGDAKGDEGKPAKPPAAEPEFKDGISVDEAINAVPQGTERVNVDNETLGKPLMDEHLYKPCKLSPAQHFKLKVAIWDGHAVGIDVTATPKNAKLEQCVKDQIKTVTWKGGVKSLNTVEYAF